MNFVVINPRATIGGIMPCKEVAFPIEFSEIGNLEKQLGINEPFVSVIEFREGYSTSAIRLSHLNCIVREFENHKSDYRFSYRNFDFDNPLKMAEYIIDNDSVMDIDLLNDCINDNASIAEYVIYGRAMKSLWKTKFKDLKSEKSVQEICELYDKLIDMDNEERQRINAIVDCDLAEDIFDAIDFIDDNNVRFVDGDDIETYIMKEVNDQLEKLPNWMREAVENQILDSEWANWCDPSYDLGTELYEVNGGLLIVE